MRVDDSETAARAERSGLALALEQNAAKLKMLGAELGIVNIRVFGSVSRGDDRYDSDIDLLVDVRPSDVPFRLGVFKGAAEQLLECEVDVVVDDPGAHKLEHIRATAVPL